MECVRTESLKKVYDQGGTPFVALKGVNLEVEVGEFMALVGPSGSGKTRSGALAVLRLKRIGFVFQEFNLIPVLTAFENVEYVMLLQGVREDERRERAHAILKEVGLEGMEARRPRELSGGQQQRVAVARAIVAEPAIVLADEPTANLDSVTEASLLDMMKLLNEEKGITFIFSTHDPEVMAKARRIVRLKDGAVVG
jgi:putative ABC transport system ATP-binding protein